MLRECLKAAEESSASLEVIDLRSLVPLDMDTVLASAERTGRLLVVHEAVQDFGAGAEIAARAGEELYDVLRAPVKPHRRARRADAVQPGPRARADAVGRRVAAAAEAHGPRRLNAPPRVRRA